LFGLPRGRRIRKRAEFVRIQDGPSARVSTPHLLFLLRSRPDGGPSRLGVVASKKVGGAVERNRAKRLVREAFRTIPEAFPPDLDVVVIVRPGTDRISGLELCDEVRRARPSLLRRAAEVIASGRRG
jgi:ribonuclease P protein component